MLKLSEAIILGSVAYPKAIGERHADDGSKCALGAAESAIGIMDYRGFNRAIETWPLLVKEVPHPLSNDTRLVYACITTLNNGLNCTNDGQCIKFEPWTRERIADWVATLEAQEEVQAENQRVAKPSSEIINA